MTRGIAFGLLLILVAAPHAVADVEGERFLRAVAPLDELRGLCVDIPGHRDRVNVSAALVVHTCKWDIWNLDERFDAPAFARGELRMPNFDLCAGVNGYQTGSAIRLGACDGSAPRQWIIDEGRVRSAAAPDMCLTIGAEPSTLTPGGRRLPSRHVARSLALAECQSPADDRQRWELVSPQR
jgi:hypothetical protein